MGVVSFPRFNLDPPTGEPHIYDHGVSQEEVEEALRNADEERWPGELASRNRAMEAGRLLRVVDAPDSDRQTLFVITAYDLPGKPLAAYRRRQRRKGRR